MCLYIPNSAGGLCGGCAVEQGLEFQSLGWTVLFTLPLQGEWSEQTRSPWAHGSMIEESTQTQELSVSMIEEGRLLGKVTQPLPYLAVTIYLCFQLNSSLTLMSPTQRASCPILSV